MARVRIVLAWRAQLVNRYCNILSKASTIRYRASAFLRVVATGFSKEKPWLPAHRVLEHFPMFLVNTKASGSKQDLCMSRV